MKAQSEYQRLHFVLRVQYTCQGGETVYRNPAWRVNETFVPHNRSLPIRRERGTFDTFGEALAAAQQIAAVEGQRVDSKDCNA